MALTTEQQMLVEQRLGNEKKSVGVAYVLWLLVGGFGAHRFYLGKTGSAIAILAMWLIGWLTVAILIGIIPLSIVGIWLLVDAFLIPGMVEQDQKTKRTQISSELAAMSGSNVA